MTPPRHRARRRRSRTLSVLVALLLAAPHLAFGFAYTDDEQRCRSDIAGRADKLARAAAQTFNKCHGRRADGGALAGVDCNSAAQADSSQKIARAAQSLRETASDRCSGLTPAVAGYAECAAPCDVSVPTVDDFGDVADCLVCLVQNEVEQMAMASQGSPSVPLGGSQARCHRGLGKQQTKLLKTVIGTKRRCQRAAERVGQTTTAQCGPSDSRGKIASSRQKTSAKVLSACSGATVADLDSCTDVGVAELVECVADGAELSGRAIFEFAYGLSIPPTTTTLNNVTTTSTTTSTSTTTTTLAPQDPQCPDLAELVLLGAASAPCAANAECAPGICDPSLGRCTTVSDLDTGWTGIAHDSDINDGLVTLADLHCSGPFDGGSSEPCGECLITGVDTATRACRCNNNTRLTCDEPFDLDAASCGTGISCTIDEDCRRCNQTTSTSCLVDDDCPPTELCMTGPRLPTCSGGQCVGSCDCYLGPPLPLSSGNTPVCVLNRLREDISGTANVDVGSSEAFTNLGAVVYLGESVATPCPYCIDDVLVGDGVRDGTCVAGETPGMPCDADAVNWTFPAPGGDGHSLDCFPTLGKNISGTGLRIDLRLTTGTVSLPAQVDCGFTFAPELCPCGVCTNDVQLACTSNADCTGSGECTRRAQGVPKQNQCADNLCSDVGGGEGECTTGPDLKFCDGVVRSTGRGFLTCSTNSDCTSTDCGTVSCGDCTLVERKSCFLPTITGIGSADPGSPISVSAFCIPPSANGSVNNTAGLPGPGRVVNQGASRTFCAGAPGVEYTPGSGGCP